MNTTPIYQMNRAALREALSQALFISRRNPTPANRAAVVRIQRKLKTVKH